MPTLSAAIKIIIENGMRSSITSCARNSRAIQKRANSGSDWPSFKRYGILRLKRRSDEAAQVAEKTKRVAISAMEAAPPQQQRMWFRISYRIYRDGEIGRHSGLKIPGAKSPVGVRFPSRHQPSRNFHTPITVPNNLWQERDCAAHNGNRMIAG